MRSELDGIKLGRWQLLAFTLLRGLELPTCACVLERDRLSASLLENLQQGTHDVLSEFKHAALRLSLRVAVGNREVVGQPLRNGRAEADDHHQPLLLLELERRNCRVGYRDGTFLARIEREFSLRLCVESAFGFLFDGTQGSAEVQGLVAADGEDNAAEACCQRNRENDARRHGPTMTPYQ